MDPARALAVVGTCLLSLSAMTGFLQARHPHSSEAFARWRVVHAGGTAGAVQLMALSAIWPARADAYQWAVAVAWGLILAACAFLAGPLATALDRPRVAQILNGVGAVVAVPTYLALPAVLILL